MNCLSSTRDADPCSRTERVDVNDKLLHQLLAGILKKKPYFTMEQIKHVILYDESAILVHCEPFLGALLSNEQLRKISLLWIAVLCRYLKTVELLVRSGADVNETFGLAQTGNICKESTVVHAMVRGYPSSEGERLIRLVMDRDVDLEARDSQGLTVLHYAVLLDRLKIAQMFLNNGADVSCASVSVGTPFSLISNKSIHNPMVQLIIKALALKKFSRPPTIELKDERLMKGYPELWDYYQDCIEHIYRTKFTRFAKNCTFFQLLTQCPCSIAGFMWNPEFENSFSLCHLNGFSMYAKDLLRAFKRARKYYLSRLHFEKTMTNTNNRLFQRHLTYEQARKEARQRSFCKCYVENIRRCELSLLLHEKIIYKQRVELVEIETLLERGADVNFLGRHKRTPLLQAARSSEIDKLLPLLIKHGADVLAKDRSGRNALHHLAKNSTVYVDQARVLIEMGVSPHDKDYKFHQPIHQAVKRGNNELVKILLDHGADVNALSIYDESPLYFAALMKDSRVVETLLQRGADVHLKTSITGNTALHSACENFEKDNIKLLLSAGADVLVENNKGETPFALITRHTYMTIPGTRLLLKELARKKVCQPSIELKDEINIRTYPWLWSHYRDCIVHLSRMKFTRLIKSCTFFDLITRNRCHIAALMRNPNFEANFELYDLSGFSMYAEDILEAFERARKCYHAMLKQEDVINEAVHYMLPYIVVREVVRHVFDCCENVKCEKEFC